MKPVGLVTCCKEKLEHSAPARDLYISASFKAAVKRLMPRVEGWAILSAKYGVVLPHTVLEPYDKTLKGASKATIMVWNKMVNLDLRILFPDRKFLAICDKSYTGGFGGLNVTVLKP